MMKQRILFVCLGNICRSSSAEEIMRMLVRRAGREKEFEIDSAGISVSTKENCPMNVCGLTPAAEVTS